MEDELERQAVEVRFGTFFSLMTGAVRVAPDFRVPMSWGGSPVLRAAAGCLICNSQVKGICHLADLWCLHFLTRMLCDSCDGWKQQ